MTARRVAQVADHDHALRVGLLWGALQVSGIGSVFPLFDDAQRLLPLLRVDLEDGTRVTVEVLP